MSARNKFLISIIVVGAIAAAFAVVAVHADPLTPRVVLVEPPMHYAQPDSNEIKLLGKPPDRVPGRFDVPGGQIELYGDGNKNGNSISISPKMLKLRLNTH